MQVEVLAVTRKEGPSPRCRTWTEIYGNGVQIGVDRRRVTIHESVNQPQLTPVQLRAHRKHGVLPAR